MQMILSESELVENGQQDYHKFWNYCKAIRVFKEWFANGKGKISFNDVNEPRTYHIITVEFLDDELNKKEIHLLSEIINMFDNMMLLANCSNGNVSFMLMMEDIYYN